MLIRDGLFIFEVFKSVLGDALGADWNRFIACLVILENHVCDAHCEGRR